MIKKRFTEIFMCFWSSFRTLAVNHGSDFFFKVKKDVANCSFDLVLAGLTGLSRYWQNEYHHLDTPPKNKDAYLTFYHSFMRITSEVLTQHQAACRFRPLQLLEVSLFQESDHFHGLLVLFKAEYLTTGKEVTLETHVHPKHYYSVLDPKGVISRLQFLEVMGRSVIMV